MPQNLLIHWFLTPNPPRTPCRALRGGNRVGRGEAAPPDLLRAPRPALSPFFFSSPSHQNPVFCHRNSSEQRGLQQRRLQQRQGASEGVRTSSAPGGSCPLFFPMGQGQEEAGQRRASRPSCCSASELSLCSQTVNKMFSKPSPRAAGVGCARPADGGKRSKT